MLEVSLLDDAAPPVPDVEPGAGTSPPPHAAHRVGIRNRTTRNRLAEKKKAIEIATTAQGGRQCPALDECTELIFLIKKSILTQHATHPLRIHGRFASWIRRFHGMRFDTARFQDESPFRHPSAYDTATTRTFGFAANFGRHRTTASAGTSAGTSAHSAATSCRRGGGLGHAGLPHFRQWNADVWTKNGDVFRFGQAYDIKREYADPAPRKIGILKGVQRVEVENQQACALLAAGEVRCYSHETFHDFLLGKEHDFGPDLAALASAFTRRKITPPPKKFVFPDGRGLSGVIDLAVFNHDASAVTDKGEVYSWGSAERGTVGRPEDTKGFFPPTRIEGFTNAVAIVGSFQHRCALEKSGEVRCFGQHGFLGNDTKADSTKAVLVQGIPKIVHLAANDFCTFAIGDDHSLWVWGRSWINACGMEDSVMTSHTPMLVPIDKTAP